MDLIELTVVSVLISTALVVFIAATGACEHQETRNTRARRRMASKRR